jgi:hypothetical protein
MKALGTSLVILSLTMAQLRHNLILVCLLVFLLTPLLSYGQPSTDATGNVDAIGNPGVSGNPNVVNPALADDPGPQPVAPTPISEAEATKKKPGAAPGKNVIPTTPTEMIIALHYWSIPFILCTLIVVSFSVERLVMLRRGRVIPKPFVDRFLLLVQEGKLSPDEALELCIENNSPIAQIFEHGVKKWGKPSVEVEQAIIDGGERQVGHLRKHLRSSVTDPSTRIWLYVDDIVVQAAPEVWPRLWPAIRAALTDAELELSPNKSAWHCPNQNDPAFPGCAARCIACPLHHPSARLHRLGKPRRCFWWIFFNNVQWRFATSGWGRQR